VTKSIVKELSEILCGGRIEKIFQPEADEILLNIRARGQNFKLLASASANYPRIHLTNLQRENPAVAPAFCMLLRKHLSGGKIIHVGFHDYERIVTVEVESVNDIGDLTVKKLVVEIMGRHSNIILVSDRDKIMDSIKHVDSAVSSVREVMPGRPYVPPPLQNKTSPEFLDPDKLIAAAATEDESTSIENYLLGHIKGFSPLLCREICFRSDLDGKAPVSRLSDKEAARLKKVLSDFILGIKNCEFQPCILYEDQSRKKPADFHCIKILKSGMAEYKASISGVVDEFYYEKDRSERLKQKKADLLKVLNNNMDRCNKKLAIQQDVLREVADREKLQLYGELITANIYSIPRGSGKVFLLNYYSEDGELVDIPLDPQLSPQGNAQKYFKQYAKAKNTFLYTSRQKEETSKEINYLESVLHLLENCTSLQEIDEVRQELMDQGYLSPRKKKAGKKLEKVSSPLHFKSKDGLDILVGKNNKQNELLTLKLASSNDIWLHTRNIPGSHVIIKKTDRGIPDTTLVQAAIIAAYYSKARLSANVPVDYTAVKNVKKPGGAKPGMVIYENFKTLTVTPDESLVNTLKVDE
jgi:predicted ribosome quality control (RQC) complex YloA/Tae2 family protein